MSDRNDTISIIRSELKRRSGKTWSVTGGKGTAWGWIKVTSPPARRIDGDTLSDADRIELGQLLGLDRVPQQGVSIASSTAHYTEYVDRARGLAPVSIATPYWD